MSNGFIYVVDAHFIDKIEKKYPGPKCLCVGGVLITVLASSVGDCGLYPLVEGQTKDYKIGICCFSDKYASSRSTG